MTRVVVPHPSAKHYDLIVIGSGAAGLSAAISAAKRNASVLVIEKSDKVGGTTAMSGALLWAPMNPWGHEVGFDDDREAAINYMVEAMEHGQGSNRIRYDMIETFVDRCAETLEELADTNALDVVNTPYPDSFAELNGGVVSGRHLEPAPFPLSSLGSHKSSLRSSANDNPLLMRELLSGGFIAKLQSVIFSNLHKVIFRKLTNRKTAGVALAGRLYKSALDLGVEFQLNASAEKLLTEEKSVIGVEVSHAHGHYKVFAKRGVVMANGGFEWNKELAEKHLPVVPQTNPSAPHLSSGDNLKFAKQVDAELEHMDLCWNWPAVKLPGEVYDGEEINSIVLAERMMPHCLWVNQKGERFCNESSHNVAFALEEKSEDGTLQNLPAWIIFDAQYREKYPVFLKIFPKAKDPDWLPKFDTIDDLAKGINVPQAALKKTLHDFSRNAERGIDPDFGRGQQPYDQELGDPTSLNPNLGTVEKAPFYAYPLEYCAVGTRGGPVINSNSQVINWSGEAVSGLYAAGNAAASFYGPNIVGGGATLTPALTFGRLAALHALGANQ